MRVNKMSNKLIIKLLDNVAKGRMERALFNNCDVAQVRAIIARAKKTKFSIIYGMSGIQVIIKC